MHIICHEFFCIVVCVVFIKSMVSSLIKKVCFFINILFFSLTMKKILVNEYVFFPSNNSCIKLIYGSFHCYLTCYSTFNLNFHYLFLSFFHIWWQKNVRKKTHLILIKSSILSYYPSLSKPNDEELPKKNQTRNKTAPQL